MFYKKAVIIIIFIMFWARTSGDRIHPSSRLLFRRIGFL